MSTLGVMTRPLGTRPWKVEDLRFLFGPVLPALVGEPGRDRLVGVIVADVACDAYPKFDTCCDIW